MDSKTIIISLITGVMSGIIVYYYTIYRKKSMNEDIKFLEYEKKHLEHMKRSSVEMNRSSFKAIFQLLFLLGLANLIPTIFSIFDSLSEFQDGITMITISIWMAFTALSIKFWQRYENIKNYKESIDNFDKKITKLQTKLKNT